MYISYKPQMISQLNIWTFEDNTKTYLSNIFGETNCYWKKTKNLTTLKQYGYFIIFCFQSLEKRLSPSMVKFNYSNISYIESKSRFHSESVVTQMINHVTLLYILFRC